MSYQVLARKYRPQNFEEVVGQEAVVATLKNAITAKRLHHAYLFSGARGIGKTSLARIFAKAINCEKGPAPIPCNQCTFCREITEGNCLDVHEIDGASNTSVEDVRELREGLKFLPAAARDKIYIIDEVHMLSTSAFNALLKTLEEPPPHVIFLFATTEVHKIPATILSRCQRFDLRRIPLPQILTQLQAICEREKVKAMEDVLLLLAREGEGSLRDAQSLLDQAIAYSGGQLSVETISSMLGLVDTTTLYQLTEAVIQGETEKALLCANEVYEKGHDLKQFAIQWLEHWRNLFVYKSTQSDKTLQGFTEAEKEIVFEQSKKVSVSTLDVGFYLLQRGIEEIARSEFPQFILEALTIRLSHASELVNIREVVEQLKGNWVSPSPVKAQAKSPAISSPPLLKKFIEQVASKRPQLGSLLDHVKKFSICEDKIYLQTDPQGIWLDMLRERKPQLEEMATEFFGKGYPIVIQGEALPLGGTVEVARPEEKLLLDPLVHSALHILDAKIEEVKS